MYAIRSYYGDLAEAVIAKRERSTRIGEAGRDREQPDQRDRPATDRDQVTADERRAAERERGSDLDLSRP